jgi:hypothetical protein
MIEPAGQASMPEVIARPVSTIKFMDEGMKRPMGAGNKRNDSRVTGEVDVVIEAQKRQDEAVENVACWIDCNLFKEDPIVANGGAYATVEYVDLKRTSGPPRGVQKSHVSSQPIGTYKHGDNVSLGQGG